MRFSSYSQNMKEIAVLQFKFANAKAPVLMHEEKPFFLLRLD